MTRRTNSNFFFDDATNELIVVDIKYKMKLKKYQKAGKYGRYIYCPYCNQEHKVYSLSWYRLICMNCEREVKKSEWWTRCNASKLSKRVALINPKVKSYVPNDRLHYGKDSIWQHH